MEMNDILNGLNPCDDNNSSTSTDSSSDSCCCCGVNNNNQAGIGMNPLAGLGAGGLGCGFGSWIWILLILFYCGCGNGLMGGNNCGNNNNCCCNSGGNNYGNNGLFGGMFGSCTGYLFLLVILFLCNSNFGGCGGFGALGNPYSALSGLGNNLNINSNCGC